MITVRDLNFTYAGTREPALLNINFAIQPGEIFGFLGPSGAGKSTTQKILMGLLREYTGNITVFGRNLRDWGADYYERVGVSFEAPNHYLKLTALENLRYFRALYAGETVEPHVLLDLVGLGTDGDKRVAQFSKGMRNRLNVARALMHKPELLFLDEPTAGLDPVNARQIRDVIRQQRDAGATIFLTTHDMTVADSLCDRVAFIVDGALALIDAPRALKLRHGQRQVRVEWGANGSTQRRDFPLQGLADNPAFLARLRDESLQTIHTQETTLENIFIDVTGRSLT